MTVRRLRSARAVAWSPHVLTRSVWRAAWDSDRADTITESGGLVQTWANYLGGEPNAATQATEASRPALDSSGAYPVVSGAAGSRFLRAGAIGTGWIPTGTATSVLFAVVQGWTTGNIVTWGGTSGASTRRIEVTNSTSVRLIAGSSGSGYLVDAGASLADPTLLTGIMTATGLIFRLNGTEVGRVSVAMPTTGTSNLTLFANTNGTPGSYGDGAISDVHITTALSDSDVLRFEGWLAHKRGITLQGGHPYASAPP